MLYLDTHFNFHIIKPCPITNLAYLQECFEQLSLIKVEYEDDSQPIVSLLTHIANLSGVGLELLLSDVDGLLQAIAKLNFEIASDENTGESKSESNSEIVSIAEYQYQLITSLVNSELAVDLQSAYEIATQLSYKDLEGCLKARIKFLNQDKVDEEKAGKELMQELADGTFFGSAKDGKDPWKDGVMAAMGIQKGPTINNTEIDDDDMPDSVKEALGL